MAITAVAAIAGGAAVSAGVVAASTLAMISVGVTAVGMVTKSKTLTKIGAGLGLGSAAAGMLGLGESAVATVSAESAAANSTAQLQANAAWAQGGAAEAAGAAQDVANASFAQAGAQEVGQGVTASALESGAAPAVEAATPRGIVDSAVAAQPASASTAPVAPSSAPQAASTASSASSSTGIGPRPITDASAVKPTVDAMPALERGSTWFDKIGEFWNGLDKSGKLAVGQAASGLVSGIGQGAMQYMAAADQREFQQQQINQRRADRGFVPDLTPYSR